MYRTGYIEAESIEDCTQTHNSITSRLSHVDRNSLNKAPTNFPLLQLPPELRLLVYGTLIAAGDLSIMRTNKFVHDEAVKLLTTHAVLRVFLGYADRTSSVLVPMKASVSLKESITIYASPVIQRIELNFESAMSFDRLSFRSNVCTGLITCFRGRYIARKSCIIYLELGLCDATPREWTFSEVRAWIAIANLTGFKTLTLKILRKEDLAYEEASPFQWRRVQIPVKKVDAYEIIYSTLGTAFSTTLGPATFCRSPTSGDFLEFHPSEFKPSSGT